MDGHKRYDLCEKLVNAKLADMTPEEKDNYIFEHMMDIVVEYDDSALELACKWVGVEYEA
jgi:hypothetical protein